MHDECRALDVAQELMAQTLAFARTLNEAGDVGNDIGVLAGTHHTQVGHERGKRIVGDLGSSGTHARDKRGLTHRGEANERGIGHELHLELNPVLLGRLTKLGKRGRAAHRRHKVRIPQTAGAAGCYDDALTVVNQVGNLEHRGLRLGVELAHHGAHGNLQDKVLAALSVAAGALTVRSALGTKMMLKAVIDQ